MATKNSQKLSLLKHVGKSTGCVHCPSVRPSRCVCVCVGGGGGGVGGRGGAGPCSVKSKS